MNRCLAALACWSLITVVGSLPAQTAAEMRELTDQMDAAQVQEAIQLLRDHYVRRGDLDDVTLSRAMLEGLLARLPHGVRLQAEATGSPETAQPPLAEILRGEVAYFRPLTFDNGTLVALDQLLREARKESIASLVLDLRFVKTPGAYPEAAELLGRFLAKGEPLFHVGQGGGVPAAAYSASRDPDWDGITIVIVDRETLGAAETVAAVLRRRAGALLICERTPGAALRYEPYLLANGMVMEVGVGEVRLAGETEASALSVLEPDLYFPIPPSMKTEALEALETRGLAAIIYDEPRPRFNEAALVAGGNPELDALQERQKNGDREPPIIDRLLQRAVDLARATAIYRPSPPSPGG